MPKIKRQVSVNGVDLLLSEQEEQMLRTFYGPHIGKAAKVYSDLLSREGRSEAPGRNDFKGMMLKYVWIKARG